MRYANITLTKSKRTLFAISELPVGIKTRSQSYTGKRYAILQQRLPVTWYDVRKQFRCGHINLVRGADEDEGGDDDVEDGVVGYEHENAVSVGCQPDVVLRNEQLKQTRMLTSKPYAFDKK